MILRQALERLTGAAVEGYQGHMPDGSSIQKHSVGSNYPYVLAIRFPEYAMPDGVVEYVTCEIIGPDGTVVWSYTMPNTGREARLSVYSRAIDRAEVLANAFKLRGRS